MLSQYKYVLLTHTLCMCSTKYWFATAPLSVSEHKGTFLCSPYRASVCNTHTHTHTLSIRWPFCTWSFLESSHVTPCPTLLLTSHPALQLLSLLSYHDGVIMVGVDYINKPLVAELTLWKGWVSVYPAAACMQIFSLLPFLIIYMLTCTRRIIPTPSSFHLPLLSLHPLF